jgi:chromosome segregation ATPase
MDDLETITTKTTEPAQPAPVIDLEQARAKVAALRAEVEAQEIAIVEGELTQAQVAHDRLLEQCEAAQHSYDELDRKVVAQQCAFFQATSRRAGVIQAIDMQRRNAPENRYGNKAAMEAWSGELSRLEDEQGASERAHGEVSTVLIGLQSERSAAAKTLETLSWQERAAGNRVAELRNRLAEMNSDTSIPNQMLPRLNGATITFSAGTVQGNPRSRKTASF